jgi:peptidyl-tRNA hydrolase
MTQLGNRTKYSSTKHWFSIMLASNITRKNILAEERNISFKASYALEMLFMFGVLLQFPQSY